MKEKLWLTQFSDDCMNFILLNKVYYPDMGNYDKWYFDFSKNISLNRSGLSSIWSYFNNGNLVKTRHEYNEADMVN